MILPGRQFIWSAFLALTFGVQSVLPAATAMPDFQEVYNLARTNGVGVTDEELNRAAVHGLLGGLGSRAVLITNVTSATTSDPIISRASVFESDIGYIRLARVADGAADAIRARVRELGATNRLSGIVLDLRYTGGMDYAAAATVGDLFLAKARPLLNWGTGMVSSREKTDAITAPVAVLVNRETAGAAEALAALLRETGTALVLGSRTAGSAMVMQDFRLSNGATLRLATAAVHLGNSEPVPPGGVRPDIDVSVSVDDERDYYADAFYVVPRTNALVVAGGSGALGTNGSRRARLNEAELVREHRGVFDPVGGVAPRESPLEPPKPVVSDPALARALDLLRGLAIVRQPRP